MFPRQNLARKELNLIAALHPIFHYIGPCSIEIWPCDKHNQNIIYDMKRIILYTQLLTKYFSSI